MASHGERRAAEMEESCVTLRELGLDPAMTEGTVRRQREMGRIGKVEAVRNDASTTATAPCSRRSARRRATSEFLNDRSENEMF